MNLSSLYSLDTTYSEEKIKEHFDAILFYQAFIWINDLDIWSWDYFKLDHKWRVIKWLDFNVDYIELLKKQVLTAPENTDEWRRQKVKYDVYLAKLDLANSYIKEPINENFIRAITRFILLDHQREELFWDGSIDFSIWKEWSNYRLNWSFEELGEWKVGIFYTIRKLRKAPYTIQQMWVTKTILERFNSSSWLVLISWPTWSAKSSTLISILDWFNKNKYLKIVTLEDPVEFFWTDLQNKCTFRQREIWKTCDTFAKWIRSAMRQSPHIIVIGELRDRESVEMAIEASLTWHLVIATIHVNSVIQVLDRLLWFFEGADKADIAWKLASSLKFLLNQRLVTTEQQEYKVAYEWLDTTADWIWHLIKDNNLQDVKKKMYELDSNGKSHHKPLNESLFELVCDWHLAYTRAYNEYSNDKKIFENEFLAFRVKYCQVKWITEKDLQERITYVESLLTKKNELERKKELEEKK